MLFGTVVFPDVTQYVEMCHMYETVTGAGVSRIEGTLYDQQGRELHRAVPPLCELLINVQQMYPAVSELALLLHEVWYQGDADTHPYQYGYLLPKEVGAVPIHYPLAIAMGLSRLINFANYSYFPIGRMPSGCGIRLFLGNPCEHAPIDAVVTWRSLDGMSTHVVTIPPCGLRIVDVDVAEHDDESYLLVSGEIRPIVYVAGVNRHRDVTTFLEHLMEVNRIPGARRRTSSQMEEVRA